MLYTGGAFVSKNLDFVLLLDCYGELLTQKQKEIADMYYNEDFSLSEIAEMKQITRQAVLDSLRHSEHFLMQIEQKLSVSEKMMKMRNCLEQILQCNETEQMHQLAKNGLRLL